MYALFVASLLAVGATPVEAHTLDGDQFRGQILSWQDEQLVLQVGGQERVVPAKSLLSVEPAPEQPPELAAATAWVRLRDGSLLSAAELTSAESTLSLKLRHGTELQVGSKHVAAIRLQDEEEEGLAEQWQKMQENEAASDLIVIRKGESLDYLEGIVGDISGDRVAFTLDGDLIPVKRSKVYGVILFHARPLAEKEVACVVQGGGSTLQAALVTAKDPGGQCKLQVVTTGGLELALPLEQVERVGYANFTYLSDLDPLETSYQPYFPLPVSAEIMSLLAAPKYDRAIAGGPLTLSQPDADRPARTFRKGLALKSGMQMTYRPPAGAQRFRALAGIDHQVREGGHVRLVVLGDERVLWEQEIRGQSAPLPIDVPIPGVRRLTIEVGYAGDLDVGDHLDLCEARFTK